MTTIYDIKKQADELSSKTNINSIPPSEVGGLIRNLADYASNIEINGGSLGIRKVYVSVAAMEADTEPIGLDGKPLKRGNLVAIYDGTDTGADNNKIYSYQKPGWVLTSKMDAAYALKSDLQDLRDADEALLDKLTERSDNNVVYAKFDNGGREIKSTYAEKGELSEYNVSLNHPTGGTDGGDKYTFEAAIIKMPVNLRNPGMKCLFLAPGDSVQAKAQTEIWIFNGGIFVDKANWTKLATQSEEEDINNVVQESINSMNHIINKQLALATSQIDTKVDEAVADKAAKPLIISSSESKAGTYNMGGEKIDIYERSVRLEALPKSAGDTKEYVIADEPLGFGIYANIDSLVASSGKGLNKEFFNFNYEIARYYINEQLQSCVVIRCKAEVAENVSGLLHIQYCKFFGDVVEFDVTLPNTVDKEAVSLEIPPLKYNKKMAFSYITDDSYAIYQYIFSAINKRMVAKKFELPDGRVLAYHLGMQGKPEFDRYVSESYYPEHFAQCSDGAGVKHRYATTVSAWADKLKDQTIGQDVGMSWPWSSEKEFKLYFDFGFMCAYHDLIGYDIKTVDTQEKFDKCMSDTAALFKEYVGRVPKLMVEPNGDHKYITFCRNNDIVQMITAQAGDPSIKKVYPFKPDFSLSKEDVTVERLFAYGSDMTADNDNPQYSQDLLGILAGFNSATDKNGIYWLIGSAHRSSHWESVLIKKIHELYGDIGNDSLWFPALEEFFEYWYIRTNTLSVKTVTETGVHYRMYVPKGANFFYRDLSVLLSGVSSTEGVSVTSGENVYGTSYAVSDGKLLVNLDFNPLLLERVNKYVDAFEADYNKEYAYDNAYYFVQMLKPGLKEPYLARINKWISPPVLESFVVNSGDDYTQSQDVTLNITFSGQAPSHYMASESADFTDAVWVEYKENPTFRLSEGFTSKNVYVKLKNVYGETPVMSDTITLLEPTLTLNAITVNGGAGSTVERSVQVGFDYIGFPTHYMLSESEAFTGAQWMAFAETPAFELSAAYGVKKVYAKLKNATTETVSRSANIELIDAVTARLNSISVNDGDEVTSTGVVQVTFNTMNTITKYKIGKQADLSDCPAWINWSNATVRFDSGMTEGELTVSAKVGNSTTESDIKSDSIRIVQPVTVTAITLAAGEESFAGFNVPVAFTIGQGTPTHYRLAESASALNSAAWLAWGDEIMYKFANIGRKTLYGQVKNEVSESTVVNDAITLTEPPVKAVIAFNGSTNNTIEYSVANGDTINQTKIALHTGYNAKQLKDSQGNLLPWYINYNSDKYAPNAIFANNNSNNYNSNTTANDEGVYPAETFTICQQCMENLANGSKKLRISLTLSAGRYKARILYSPANAFLLAENYRLNSYYGVFAGETQLAKVNVGKSGFTGSGNNQYNNEIDFTVSADGDIDFAAWQEGSTIQNYRPGINLIELTKLS